VKELCLRWKRPFLMMMFVRVLDRAVEDVTCGGRRRAASAPGAHLRRSAVGVCKGAQLVRATRRGAAPCLARPAGALTGREGSHRG
jgi:hypothetical protein